MNKKLKDFLFKIYFICQIYLYWKIDGWNFGSLASMVIKLQYEKGKLYTFKVAAYLW